MYDIVLYRCLSLEIFKTVQWNKDKLTENFERPLYCVFAKNFLNQQFINANE